MDSKAQGMAKDITKAELEAAKAAQEAGKELTQPQRDLVSSSAKASSDRTDSLINSGIGAVGGAAGGALEALLTPEPKRANSAIPTGGGGNIPRGGGGEINLGRMNLGSQQGPSLALEMLRRGGYKA